MASPSLPPYEYEEVFELNYEFISKDGIKYHLFFTPMDVLYPDMVMTIPMANRRSAARCSTGGLTSTTTARCRHAVPRFAKAFTNYWYPSTTKMTTR